MYIVDLVYECGLFIRSQIIKNTILYFNGLSGERSEAECFKNALETKHISANFNNM
jgi:hypothetical protein